MDGGIDTYILLTASGSGRYAPEVINSPTAQTLKGRGIGGGIANNMYNNDVGKGVVYAYESYEAK